ncbi:MAG: DUF6491 family protein [Arenimonas sp.]
MRFLPILLLSSISLAMPASAGTDSHVCLDSSRVRNWVVVNDETLLLDAGSNKYRVSLQQSCFNLSTSPTLQFKGDQITGRICGSTLDAIRIEGELCRISKIEKIDKQTYNDAQNKKKVSLKLKKT